MPGPRKKATKKVAKKAVKKPTPTASSSIDDLVRAMPAGELVIRRASDEELWSNVPGYVSTRSIALDKAIGRPGIPLGRVSQISGDAHIGKSTLVDQILAEAQANDMLSVLYDNEASRDMAYTQALGVDLDKLAYVQMGATAQITTVQGCFNHLSGLLDWLATNQQKAVVAIDTISVLPTDEDLVRDMGEVKPGDTAKTIAHGLRCMMPRVARTKAAVIFVNHVYEPMKAYGGKVERGGRGLTNNSSLIVRLSRGRIGPESSTLKMPDGSVYGRTAIAEIIKCRLAGTTGRRVNVAFMHGAGVDNVWELYHSLKGAGVITSGGGWSTIQGPDGEPIRFRNGHFGLAEVCQQNSDLYRALLGTYMEL